LDVIKGALPKDVGNPILVKFDPASFPIVTLGISGPSDLEALTRIATDEIKQKLERIPGVALARIGGGVERQILVAVDQGRLFAYRIPISTVVDKLKTANFNFPGGSIERGKSEIRIRTMGQFESLEDIRRIVLSKTSQQIPIFLRDIATVSDTFKEQTSSFHVNGEKSIGVSIFKQADSNTVKVAEAVVREVETLRDALGEKVNLTVVYNQALFIKDAIADLELAGILGGILAFLILLLFLGSFQTALIVTTAIPISVLGVFTLMYMSGITLNIMSLGGLALGVGLLVDNGIVILENIHRHRKTNPDAYQSAIIGSAEMQRPVIASTLAHIIVFLPIIFVQGLAGKFFVQLALTISFSLLISILVALLLNPMLESKRKYFDVKLPKLENPSFDSKGETVVTAAPVRKVRNVLHTAIEPFRRLVDFVVIEIEPMYIKVLESVLKHRTKALAFTTIVVSSSMLLIPLMGKEFIPNVDQGNVTLKIRMPVSTTLEATDEMASRIGAKVLTLPEVKDIFVNIGHDAIEKTETALGEFESNTARMTVLLNDERQRSVEDIVNVLRDEINGMGEFETEFVFNQNVQQMLRQKSEATEILEISGPSLEMLADITSQVSSKLSRFEFLQDLQSNLGDEENEIQIVLDREKAATFKLTVKNIADTLKTAIEGEVATTYYDTEQEVDIVVKLRDEDRKDINKLEQIFIHTPSGSDIPLVEIAEISIASRPRQLNRRDLRRVAVISANIIGISFDEAIKKVQEAIDDISLFPDYSITVSDVQKEMNRSFNSLLFALLFSILLVYMLLASLFESFLNPFIIMFAVPLAAVGVILILFLFNTPISLGVYIGCIMLGGIVVNNSIILLDYTERLRKQGLALREAIIHGGRTRLRPILMTALTTILGLIPLASSFGSGSEIRRPLAITVIGGLATSTFMTLIIVPVIYSLFEDLRLKTVRRDR
jgi:HAE1 family hydrophobic/amphiphilic exporter-1